MVLFTSINISQREREINRWTERQRHGQMTRQSGKAFDDYVSPPKT